MAGPHEGTIRPVKAPRKAFRPQRSQTTPPRPRGLHPAGALARTPQNKAKTEKGRSPHQKRGKSLQASTITPFEARGLLSGAVQAKTSSTRGTRSHPSPASGWNSSPRRVHASPEGLLRQRAPPRLSRGPARVGFVVKQPWPYRLTNRPLRRRIKCRGCLTPYPDTRASVGQAEVTAVTSPLFFTV